jgi:AraC-like DNA-binding protein
MIKSNIYRLLVRLIYILFISLLFPINFYSQNVTANANQKELLSRLYNNFSNIYKSSLEKGIGSAEEALSISKKLNNKFIQAQSLIYIGRYANKKRDAVKSKNVLLQAISISKEISNEYLEANAYLNYGYYLSDIINKPDSGLVILKEAYSIAASINDTTLLKLSSARLVWIYKQLNDPINAIRISKIALEHNKNDLVEIASIYNALAIVYGDSGNPKESIKYYELTLQISDKIKDEFRIASVYNNLAAIYAALVKQESSIEYFKKALAIYNQLKDSFGIGYTYNCIGMTYSIFSDDSKAIDYFQKAIKVFKEIQNKQSLSFALTNLASEYIKVNKLDLARSNMLDAVKYSEEINDKLAMLDAYGVTAQYFRKKNNIDESIQYLKLSEQLAKEINNPNFLLGVYDGLSQCYNQKDDSKNAFYYLHLKDAIADTLRKHSSEKALVEMMVKYETTKTKKEAEKSKLEINKLQNESKNKSFVVWIVIAASCTIIAILFVVFWKKFTIILQHYKALIKKPFNDARNIKLVLKAIETEKSDVPKLDSLVSSEIIEKLNQLMNEEKIYLSCDLTLDKVAKKLTTNTTYLSRTVNEQFDMSFSNYLNKYRIEEAKVLICKHEQDIMSFEGIANSCGFKSRSSFNQAFKRFTGMTPTEFSAAQNKLE